MPPSKPKTPKVGEIVHVVPAAQWGEKCRPMIVTEVNKNDKTADGTLIGKDRERLVTITGEAIGLGGSQKVMWESEYSPDGQRTTWHPINACPMEED